MRQLLDLLWAVSHPIAWWCESQHKQTIYVGPDGLELFTRCDRCQRRSPGVTFSPPPRLITRDEQRWVILQAAIWMMRHRNVTWGRDRDQALRLVRR